MSTTSECERDALTYFEALYANRPEGSLIALTEKPTWQSTFVDSPVEAARYVVGQVDVYNRVTPLRERPESGRGGADLAASLPGAWADIDISGSPDGKGGVVEGAAP